MEPMDFDSDDDHNSGTSRRRGLSPWSSFPSYDGVSRESASDMDISPVFNKNAVRSSSSWEQMRNALLEPVVSLNSPVTRNEKKYSVGDGNLMFMSLPATSDSNHLTQISPSKRARSTSREMRHTVVHGSKGKRGYGIPPGDTIFAHFPEQNSYPGKSDSRFQKMVGGTVHRRKTNALQTEMDISGQQLRNVIADKSGAKEEEIQHDETRSGLERTPFKTCCRTCFHLLELVLTVGAIFCAFIYMMDLKVKGCKESREFDSNVLEMNLEHELFGQHIASKMIPHEIYRYFSTLHVMDSEELFNDTAPAQETLQQCKPLVLSFHGWTGVGKTFVSHIIANSFKHSKTSHFVIPLNFPHNTAEDLYYHQIRQWIIGNFTSCYVNVFVMDEIDKAQKKVVDGIAEAIQALSQPCIYATPVIFLLLSNSHAHNINRVFLKFFQDSQKGQREHLTFEHFSTLFDTEGDMWYSRLVSDGLLSTFVPFLPLEREQVIQCIKRDLISKRYFTDLTSVNRILQELSFSTAGDLMLSTTGCKRVADKVDYIMMDKQKESQMMPQQ